MRHLAISDWGVGSTSLPRYQGITKLHLITIFSILIGSSNLKLSKLATSPAQALVPPYVHEGTKCSISFPRTAPITVFHPKKMRPTFISFIFILRIISKFTEANNEYNTC